MPTSQRGERAAQEHAQSELARMLYKQSMPGFVVSLFNATILVFALWPVVEHHDLMVWYGLSTAIIVGRWQLARRCPASWRLPSDAQRWAAYYAVGAALAGLVWGLAGTWLLPLDSPLHQTFIFIVLAGMSAGAVPFLSSVTGVLAAYVGFMLLPVVLWQLWQGNALHILIALMLLAYLAGIMVTSRHILNNLRSSLELRFQNEALVEALTESKVELELTNERLSREVDDHAQARKDVVAGKQFLEKIMDSTSNAIWVMDLNGMLVHTNRKTKELSGYTLDQLKQQAFVNLFPPSVRDELKNCFQRVISEDQEIANMEFPLLSGDGTQRTVSVSLTPMWEHGHLGAVVGTVEDITQRKLLDRMKDEFVSTVSHELRTPLTSIRGSLGLLRGIALDKLDQDMRKLVILAEQNTRRLITLINDLLDMQKLETGQMRFHYRAMDLEELLEQAVAEQEGYGHEYQVSLCLQPPPEPVRVNVDPDRFQQIMANLLSNAVKFSPPEKSVTVRADIVEAEVEISVRDEGEGIPEGFRDRIFQRFAQADSSDTRQRGGTGLGLSIVKALVEQMHGTVSYESTPGQGTTFRFRLPIHVTA